MTMLTMIMRRLLMMMLSQRRACFVCTGCNSRKLGLTKLPPVNGRSFWALGLCLVRRGNVLCFWVRQDFAQIAAADTWMHGRMDGGGGPEDAWMDGRMDGCIDVYVWIESIRSLDKFQMRGKINCTTSNLGR